MPLFDERYGTSRVISNEVRNLSSLKRDGIERSLAALDMTAIRLIATI
jgi:hypothetical protein